MTTSVPFADLHAQYLGIKANLLEDYGAFDVSVVSDLPLFIDPFLLFHSDKPEYQALHERILTYLRFLRDKATPGTPVEFVGPSGSFYLREIRRPLLFLAGQLDLDAGSDPIALGPEDIGGQLFDDEPVKRLVRIERANNIIAILVSVGPNGVRVGLPLTTLEPFDNPLDLQELLLRVLIVAVRAG